MKRGKRLLILLLALVLVIGATYAAKLLSPTPVVEETVTTTVFSVAAEDVTGICWDYSEEVSFHRSGDTWLYDKDTSFPLDETYIDDMLSVLQEVKSYKIIENVEDWDQYTLEEPICRIQVSTADGDFTLKIGEETSIGGQRYLSTGDGNAYLVSSSVLTPFCYGLYDVLVYETIPTMSDIHALEVKSQTEAYKIEYLSSGGLAYSDSYVWFMDEQVLDTELTEALIDVAQDITWNDCVNFHALTPSDYGLEPAAASVTLYYTETIQVATDQVDESGEKIYESQTRDTEFVLELGNTSGTKRYARIAGSSMVYTIDNTIAETLLNTTYYDLLPDEVLIMDWDEVTSMELCIGEETVQLTKGEKTVTDDEGNETTETIWLLNDAEADVSDITSGLDSMTSTGYAMDVTPTRAEELRIRIHREHETFPEIELVFYQYDSSQCLTTLNGTATVFSSRSQVLDLTEAVNQLLLS